MVLSDRAHELMAEFDRLANELAKLSDELSKEFESSTDGEISVCQSYDTHNRQLYHNRRNMTSNEVIAAIKNNIADDAAISLKWSDKNKRCYGFTIDRMPFCVVLDKDK